MSSSQKTGRSHRNLSKTIPSIRAENDRRSGHSPSAGTRLDPRPLLTAAAARPRSQEAPNAKQQYLCFTSGCSVRSHSSPPVLRRSVGASPISRPSSSHLEMARVRAFQAGVLSATQFIEFSCARPRPLLPPSNAHQINAPLLKPPPVFFERVYAAVGKPVPEHIREKLRREEEQEDADDYARTRRSRRELKADNTVSIQVSQNNINPGAKSGKAEWDRREQERATKDDEEAYDSGQSRRYPRSVFLSLPKVVHTLHTYTRKWHSCRSRCCAFSHCTVYSTL